MYRAMSGSFPFNIPGTPSAAFHSHDLRDAPLSPSAASGSHAAPLHTVADEEPTTPRLAPTTDDGPKVHLVKLIARAGVASRRDAVRLIAAGRVLVDGAPLAGDASYLIPVSARVSIDGKPFLDPAAAAAATTHSADAELSGGEDAEATTPRSGSPLRVPAHLGRPRVWLYYKPVGLLVSHKDDERARRTVFQQLHDDYFAEEQRLQSASSGGDAQQPDTVDRLLSVGRLDYSSEGLMVLTNNGGIQGYLEHPSTGFERVYRIKLNGALAEEQEEQLRAGLNVDGFQFKPVRIVRLTSPASGRRSSGVWYEVTLNEGKNRELRTLMNYFDRNITKLIRVGFHNWKIDVDFMRQHVQAMADATPVQRARMDAKAGPLAKRPVAVYKQPAGLHGQPKFATYTLVPGQLVEIEWPSHLEQMRKGWAAAQQEETRLRSRSASPSSPSRGALDSPGLVSRAGAISVNTALNSCANTTTAWLPARHMSTSSSSSSSAASSNSHSPFSASTTDAFIAPKPGHNATAAAATAVPSSHSGSPAASPAVSPLPSHIHSATCGCSHHDDSVFEDDGQLIAADAGEGFLAGMSESLTAAAALTSSMQHLETLPTPAQAAAGASASPSAGAIGDKWTLASMLTHNHDFVMQKKFEPYLTDRFPYKKLVVVTCMDTRLVELLPMALDLKNGDAKVIKVAGAIVAHPFGSVMRSILVAVYALGAEHIVVVGHHDCGMTGLDPNRILAQAKQRGIPETTFKTLTSAGLNLGTWLSGFDSVQSSVLHSVDTIRNHPLLNFQETTVKASEAVMGVGEEGEAAAASCAAGAPPASVGGPAASVARTRLPKISVTGLVICPTTGRLDLLTPTDPETQKLVNEQRAMLAKAGLLKQEESQSH